MKSKLMVTNSAEHPLLVVIEPMAEDYILVPGESLSFVAQEIGEDFYFSMVLRSAEEMLVYVEGSVERVVAYDSEGNVVEYGHNRHLNPNYPKFP
ncbi:hypothetical protein [Myxococcus landrumensis]|uniref:Lipoprotein n=1 Tax=Myxococcus landrumensis TaxID=2813577 RepID=A0ABX7N5N6_9BACT|nr:hypothetical protein [Myxococcus landrumus]QSQ13768.1 hypothetical protein JY572_36490 [Myxococcus landrumus]